MTIWIHLLIMIPVIVLMSMTPYLTRRIESFGVTIPEDAQNRPDLIGLRRRFLWINLVLGAAALLSVMLLTPNVDEETGALIFAGHLIGYLILSFVIYLLHHNIVKKLKEREKWSDPKVQRVTADTRFRSEKLVHSYLWFLPHAILTAALFILSIAWYDRFPEQLPMKYSVNGEIIHTVAKSYSAVLLPVAIQCFMLVVFIFINYTISRSKQLVESSDPEGSLKRNILFRRRWSAFMIGSGFLMMLMFTFMQATMLVEIPPALIQLVPMLVAGAMVIATVILSFMTGQGGSRIKLSTSSESKTAPAADQDRYWKLGQFYFNPNDPAIFVEKRFGIGWTMNFAKPLAWILIAAIIAIPLILSLTLG